MPEEPMHILINGPEELIAKADPFVDIAIAEAEIAPVEDVLDEANNGRPKKNALALAIQTPSQMSSYRPTTVAQLISPNPVLTSDWEDFME